MIKAYFSNLSSSQRTTYLTCLIHFSWAFVLWRTNGWYSPGWMFALPMILWFSFVGMKNPLTRSSLMDPEPALPLLLAGFTLLQLLKIQLFFQTQPKNHLLLQLILSTIFGLSVMRIIATEVHRKKLDILLYVLAITYVSTTLIIASPPQIDVWEFLQISSRAILEGKNPYSIEYPLGFAGQFAPFPYPPIVIYFVAPFQGLLGDVRYGFLLILLFSSYLGLIAKSQSPFRFTAASALLLFPSTVHVLEQSWTDLFTLLPIALVAYARRSENQALYYSGVLLLPLVKTYNFVLVPFLLLKRMGTKRLLQAGFLSILILIVLAAHLALFCPQNEAVSEFLKRMLSPPFLLTEIRHFTLYDWIQSKGLLLPTSVTYLVSLCLIATPFIIALRAQKEIAGFLWGSFALMAIFLLYPNTALNYIWIAYVALYFHYFSESSNRRAVSSIVQIDYSTWLFGLTRIILIFAIPSHLSDTGYYFEIAKNVLHESSILQAIQRLEYPPLAIFPILFPTIFGSVSVSNEQVYRLIFLLLPILADATLFFLIKNYRGHGRALLYSLLTLFMAELIYDRIDLLMALIIVVPLTTLFSRKPTVLQDLMLAVGGLFKIIPMTFVGLPGLSKGASPWKWATSFIVPVIIFFSTVFVFSRDGELPKFLSYHLSRGIQVESALGNLALILKKLGQFPEMEISSNFGAQHIQINSRSYVAAAKSFTVFATIGSYLWILFQNWRGFRPSLGLMCSTVLCAFVASNSTLSPQFIIWLIPLFLMKTQISRREIGLLTAISAITGLHFHFYWDYVNGNGFGLFAILIRNALLCVLWMDQALRIGKLKVSELKL